MNRRDLLKAAVAAPLAGMLPGAAEMPLPKCDKYGFGEKLYIWTDQGRFSVGPVSYYEREDGCNFWSVTYKKPDGHVWQDHSVNIGPKITTLSGLLTITANDGEGLQFTWNGA